MSMIPASAVTSSRAEWDEARAALLLLEKAHTRANDELTARRNALPLYRLPPSTLSTLTFHSTADPSTPLTLAELFDSTDRLLVYHSMAFQQFPCGSCTVECIQLNTIVPWLAPHAKLVVISRGPVERLVDVARTLQWSVPVYSCGLDFTRLVGVESTDDPSVYKASPGLSSWVLDRATGAVFLAYATRNRGVEAVDAIQNWFDRIGLHDRKDRTNPKFPWPVDESGSDEYYADKEERVRRQQQAKEEEAKHDEHKAHCCD